MIRERHPLGITILGSGSRGNAIVIHTPSDAVLVDAGFSARELRRRMRCAGIDETTLKGIIVSHEHSDHVKGLRVCAKQLNVPVYANRNTADVIRFREQKMGAMHIFTAGALFEVGPFEVEPFSIPHDANDPVGFVLRFGGRKIGIATDLGHASHLVTYQLRECDGLVLEANHDIEMLHSSARPWSLKQRILSRHGHLSNDDSADLIGKVVHSKTRHLVLAHASEECNRPELVERCTLRTLEALGRTDIKPLFAEQNEILPTLWL